MPVDMISGLPVLRHLLDQRDVHQFERRQLVRRDIHLLQKIHGAVVERRGEKIHARDRWPPA